MSKISFSMEITVPISRATGERKRTPKFWRVSRLSGDYRFYSNCFDFEQRRQVLDEMHAIKKELNVSMPENYKMKIHVHLPDAPPFSRIDFIKAISLLDAVLSLTMKNGGNLFRYTCGNKIFEYIHKESDLLAFATCIKNEFVNGVRMSTDLYEVVHDGVASFRLPASMRQWKILGWLHLINYFLGDLSRGSCPKVFETFAKDLSEDAFNLLKARYTIMSDGEKIIEKSKISRICSRRIKDNSDSLLLSDPRIKNVLLEELALTFKFLDPKLKNNFKCSDGGQTKVPVTKIGIMQLIVTSVMDPCADCGVLHTPKYGSENIDKLCRGIRDFGVELQKDRISFANLYDISMKLNTILQRSDSPIL